MATGSDFAWPSVTVKRGSTVVKGRSIVKCSWSDNFGILLEKVGSEFSAEVVIQVVISKMKSWIQPTRFHWMPQSSYLRRMAVSMCAITWKIILSEKHLRRALTP